MGPFLAIATLLIRRGAHVAIATHHEFRALVESVSGCVFVELGGSPRAMLRQFPRAFMDGALSEEIAFSRVVMEQQRENRHRMLEGAQAFSASAVVGMMSCHLECVSVATLLGVPAVVCSTYPLYPTSERIPLSMIGNERAFPLPVAQFFSWAGFKVAWRMMKDDMNGWRTSLGLLPLEEFSWDYTPVINMYSPLMAPRPSDWPAHVYDAGYCSLTDVAESWSPGEGELVELREFLRSGSAPIYFGFGSMPTVSTSKQIAMFDSVCEKLDRRGLVLATESDEEILLAFRDAKRVMRVENVPHEWLFAQCCVAVHHGGAGTTATALKAGIPCACVLFLFFSLIPHSVLFRCHLLLRVFGAGRSVLLGAAVCRFGSGSIAADEHQDAARGDFAGEVERDAGISLHFEQRKNNWFGVFLLCFYFVPILLFVSPGLKLSGENGTEKTVQLLCDLFAWMQPKESLEICWKPGSRPSNCAKCGVAFGVIFNRLRQCASCGRAECSECLTVRKPLPNYKGVHYVCEVCVVRVGKNGTSDPFCSSSSSP